jgi:peptidoglycan/xylan/chitin deacetylase (PgdA/CDA1 family)
MGTALVDRLPEMEAGCSRKGLIAPMRVTTLLFHDVVPNRCWDFSGFAGAGADIYKLDVVDFRDHVRAISSRAEGDRPSGQSLSVAEALRNPVVITIDDGGVSAITHTADVLEEFGWRGTFLMTTGRIGTRGFLNTYELVELDRRGHTIGSHSDTHPTRMAHCSRKQLDEEWRVSTDKLSQILSRRVDVASVPGGFYSREVAIAAAGAGIRVLFNSEPVTKPEIVEGCRVFGRFTVQQGHTPEWAAAVAAGSWKEQFQQYAYWNAKKAAKTIGGPLFLKVREHMLSRRAAAAEAAGEQPQEISRAAGVGSSKNTD